ncbi:energy transducer TonB [Methylobacterium sp. J-070]|uniref:energy transducer TonB family protein n=1 Tax=Methylobacterium sp. J-070 TaxID=2836650 RepID=UPI001FBBC970|nr:energy transducer TonB [Methylobacterium sp. J-070]MCJ2053937.1 energy transducer TonB [Methylobacterium sp. J-070]
MLGLLLAAGPSVSRDGVSPAVHDWLSAFITKIDEADHARRPSAGNKASGRVVVRVEVAEDGTVKRAEVERSSGSSALDQRAIAAVRAVSPFTAPPAELLAGADVTDLSFPLQLGR